MKAIFSSLYCIGLLCSLSLSWGARAADPQTTAICEADLSQGLSKPPGHNDTRHYVLAGSKLQTATQKLMNNFGPDKGVYWVGVSPEHRDFDDDLSTQEYAIVTRPDLIAAALKNPDLVDRSYRNSRSLAIKAGQDSILLAADSDADQARKWQLAHRALAPFFRPRFLEEKILPQIQVEANSLLKGWLKQSKKKGSVQINSGLEHYTLANVLEPLFGQQLPDPVEKKFSQVLQNFFSPDSPEVAQRAREQLESLVRPAVQEAKRSPSPDHLISDLLRVKEEENLPKSWIYDQLITLYFAGQVTTKVMIGMALYYLAENPEYQDALRREYKEFLDGKRAFSELEKSRDFLNETLRLFPPVPVLFRYTTKPIQLGDFSIPEDTSVLLNIYAGFQREEIWGKHPEEFRPERFSKKEIGKYDFCPFGFGPRICIGQSLALMEGQVLIGELLQRVSRIKRDGAFELPDIENTGLLYMSSPLKLKLSTGR